MRGGDAKLADPTAGDIAILKFLSAAEQLEDDLWQQYDELARGNRGYNAALRRIDRSLVRYISDDRDDERSHAALINGYLKAIGEQPVDLSPFRTLPSVKAPGADQRRRRLTNLTNLTVDTSWYLRYRGTGNPDFGDTFPQLVDIVNRPTVPTSWRSSPRSARPRSTTSPRSTSRWKACSGCARTACGSPTSRTAATSPRRSFPSPARSCAPTSRSARSSGRATSRTPAQSPPPPAWSTPACSRVSRRPSSTPSSPSRTRPTPRSAGSERAQHRTAGADHRGGDRAPRPRAQAAPRGRALARPGDAWVPQRTRRQAQRRRRDRAPAVLGGRRGQPVNVGRP